MAAVMINEGSRRRFGVGGEPVVTGKDAESVPVNAMSVDVEDWFQVSAFAGHIDRGAWAGLPHRVEKNVDRILALFSRSGVRATFFTLGWVAERYPHLVRRIASAGHEVASHGWSHVRVSDQEEDTFRSDVVRTKSLLEDITGASVLGYRAPSYSIGRNNLWALRVLDETGHLYSSSIYPIRHDHYGMPGAPRFAFQPNAGSPFLEIPVSTFKVGQQVFPCGGGGFFRLLPYRWSRWALRRVNRVDGESCVFYFHPWEIDPDQPRQVKAPLKSRFRHYVNLDRMEGRLTRLLHDFHWERMDHLFVGWK
jgi:polysaccharide deacetylase family protein (PEP-CTERM system associated)